VPASKTKSSSTKERSSRSSRRVSREVPVGRPCSPSQIKSPKPYNPVQTAHIVQGYSNVTVDELTQRFGYANLDNEDSSDDDSDADSDLPSLTSSRSSASSSPSSVSALPASAHVNATASPAQATASSSTVVEHAADSPTLRPVHLTKRPTTRAALPAATVLSSATRWLDNSLLSPWIGRLHSFLSYTFYL